jgi:hypothetical protein
MPFPLQVAIFLACVTVVMSKITITMGVSMLRRAVEHSTPFNPGTGMVELSTPSHFANFLLKCGGFHRLRQMDMNLA